jgi:3-(3-hydroxy-phenyl)propionate hydroxylase
VYRFHALLAQRWRERRVFLVGDACHQTPPFLGQGMCAGIRDAANLAWKLSMLLQEGAPDALHDTYEQERKPHVRRLVATAKEFGLIIGELDPAAAQLRDETLRGQLERGEAETIRQRFVPNLTTGVIDAGPQARGAGSLFVQPKVYRDTERNDEALLDDLLQPRFLIAATTSQAQRWMTSESRALWRRLGGERVVIGSKEQIGMSKRVVDDDIQYLVETDCLFAEWMAKLDSAAVVVRPDRYVFGAASNAEDLNRLIASVGRQVLAT